MERTSRYSSQPWGVPSLGAWILSSRHEAKACASCVHRLWLLHQDYHLHVTGKAVGPPQVLRPHLYMLKGACLGRKDVWEVDPPSEHKDGSSLHPPSLLTSRHAFTVLSPSPHITPEPNPTPPLSGIQDKYAPAASDRAKAWVHAGLVPQEMLYGWLSSHFRLEVTQQPTRRAPSFGYRKA